MFVKGQKVICINDDFPEEVKYLYVNLPKKDFCYIVREVSLGVNWKCEAGEIAICLEGMYNPKSLRPPYPERAFNAERFVPLGEIAEIEYKEQTDLITS